MKYSHFVWVCNLLVLCWFLNADWLVSSSSKTDSTSSLYKFCCWQFFHHLLYMQSLTSPEPSHRFLAVNKSHIWSEPLMTLVFLVRKMVMTTLTAVDQLTKNSFILDFFAILKNLYFWLLCSWVMLAVSCFPSVNEMTGCITADFRHCEIITPHFNQSWLSVYAVLVCPWHLPSCH